MLLYWCLFLSWLIYVGIWVIGAGGSFVRRFLDILNNGQAAAVTASVSGLDDFIWLHRLALLGTATLVAWGLVSLLIANRAAGLRVLAWFGTAAAWLPLLLLGEFGDRGPLFAALPAALCIGYAVSRPQRAWVRRAAAGVLLLTAVASTATAYSNHIGEGITAAEVRGFQAVVAGSGTRRIAYGYVPPLAGADLALYSSGRLRAYAVGAADFSYTRLTGSAEVIVLSDQMRAAAALRGPRALADLDGFEAQLQADPRYERFVALPGVRAYRTR